MSKVPYMPFYPERYLADDRLLHFTLEQHGAYLLLLMHMWNRGGQLLDDDRYLARLVHATPKKWQALRSVIISESSAFAGPKTINKHDTQFQPMFAFVDSDSGIRLITQKKLREEYEKSVALIEKKREGGRKGGSTPKGLLKDRTSSPQGQQEESLRSPSNKNTLDLEQEVEENEPGITLDTPHQEEHLPSSKGGVGGNAERVSPPAEEHQDPPIKPTYPEPFERLWRDYPRKVEKHRAYAVWQRNLKAGIDPDQMAHAVQHYATACLQQQTETRYIKHPATFLGRDGAWLDYETPPVDAIPAAHGPRDRPATLTTPEANKALLRRLWQENQEREGHTS